MQCFAPGALSSPIWGYREQAAEVYQELLDKILAYEPDSDNDLSQATLLCGAYLSLAALDRQIGRLADADGLDARRQEIWKHWDRKLPNNPFALRQIAAMASP
jgi:hypothetical protein